MSPNDPKIDVYYDGACPRCVRDRENYERLAGESKRDIHWIDITGRETLLRVHGIDPLKALMELHVRDEKRRLLVGIDAYVLLMNRVPVLKPLAKFIGSPLLRDRLARVYRRSVERRLRRSGRL